MDSVEIAMSSLTKTQHGRDVSPTPVTKDKSLIPTVLAHHVKSTLTRIYNQGDSVFMRPVIQLIILVLMGFVSNANLIHIKMELARLVHMISVVL